MAESSIGALALIVGALVAGTIGREAVRSFFGRQQDPTSQAFLSRVASEINKNLPMIVDKETELVNVLGLEATIVYNYRLVNADASEVDASAFIGQMQPTVSKAACSSPQTRDDFLEKGITMRYSYADQDRVHIASFDVTPQSCGF
jgi:hypothetical protein